MNGIDYSAWRPPSPAWLVQNGIGFVCRYLKVLPNSYAITAAEFQALRAAGVQVVLNWEEDTNDWQTSGVSYAQQAKAQAQQLGAWPCPIYFSVDTGSPSMAQVDDYFAGVASVIGSENTGIYGGYDVVTEVDKSHVSWFWQTYAWSNGRWADVHIRQIPGGTLNYDLNQSMAPNFGQVGAATTPGDPPEMFHGAQDFDSIANSIQGIGGQANPSQAYFAALLSGVQGLYNLGLTAGLTNIDNELKTIQSELDNVAGSSGGTLTEAQAASLATIAEATGRIEAALKGA